MERRAFVTGSVALLATPLAAEAQDLKVPRIGWVWLGVQGSESRSVGGLRQGLRELGYIEGQNLHIEYRYADGNAERLPDLLRGLIRLGVDVLLTPGTQVTRAAQQVTKTVPIVSTSTDPVGSGFVASLARPGSNVTGLSLTTGCEIWGKRLELLKEAFPRVITVAVLWNPDNASMGRCLTWAQSIFSKFGFRRKLFEARAPGELDAALTAITKERVTALLVAEDPLLVALRGRVVEFAAARRLPALYGQREEVDAGGLMSYSTDIGDVWRRGATYVDKILKGATPADLPVEQPTKFELVINLKTAKALGLTIPPAVLARADEVIHP